MSTDEPQPGNANEGGTLLEQNQRFSRSVLWKLQRAYYAERGPSAWTSGEVPHYVTCNAYIAQCYAEMVMAYLRDLARAGTLVRSEPVLIVELGAGVGAFAAYFLHKFGELKEESSLRELDVRYVMTDFALTNPKAWSEHPHLRPFVKAGILAFGRFDMGTSDSIELLDGGAIGKGQLKNPVVVLGNYIFDTIPQDIFRVEQNRLCEVQITTRAPDGGSFELSTLRTQYSHQVVEEAGYYEDAHANQLLADYRALLADTTFSIPVAGFHAMDRLLGFAGGRGMLLTSDKGFAQLDELYHRDGQSMQLHGSFSTMVNFHALGRWFELRGGVAAVTSRRQMNLKTAMSLAGGAGDDFSDTLSMFRRRIEDFGPGDFFESLELAKKTERSLEGILGLLKLSCYDPGVLFSYADAIRTQCKDAPEWLQVEVRLAIDRVWSLYYLTPQNVPFEVGRILLAMGRPLEGARFNQIAIDWFGDIPAAYLNMGICYYYAENPTQALRCLERAKELNPDFAHPREWIARIQGERERATKTYRPHRVAAPAAPAPAAAAPAAATSTTVAAPSVPKPAAAPEPS